MPVTDFIEKLQRKPDHEKRRILYGSVALLGVVVFMLWILTLKGTLAGAVEEVGTQPAAPLTFLISQLKENFPR